MIVFLNNGRPEISILVCNIVFFKLFFFMRPIKNRVTLFFCFGADVFANLILLVHKSDYVVWLLWGAIIALNVFMLAEDVLSQYFYAQLKGEQPDEHNEKRAIKKIYPANMFKDDEVEDKNKDPNSVSGKKANDES